MSFNNVNEDTNIEEIFKKIESYFGFVPKIFQVLAENPSAFKAYFMKFEILMTDETLPSLTKEFVSIGAASALGAEHCLSTHLNAARKFGATNDQLLLAILLGSMTAETDALAQSLRTYEEFKD